MATYLLWSLSVFSSPSNAASQGISDTLATTSKGVRSPLCSMTQLSRAGTGHAIPPHLPISTASLARHGGDVTYTVKTFMIGFNEGLGMAGSTWVGCWSEPIASHPGELVPGGDDHPCPSALWLASVTYLIQTWCATSCGRTLESPGLLTSPQPLRRVQLGMLCQK